MLRIRYMANFLFVSVLVGCSGSQTTIRGSGGAVAEQGGSKQGGGSAVGTLAASGGALANGGSSSAAGGTHAASGGTSATGGSGGGSAVGTSTLDCAFSYSAGSITASDCHVSGNSQHSCEDAANCMCANSSSVSGCYSFLMTPHGSASFTDFCARSTTSATVRSLADALTMLATDGNGTATPSADCSQIRAIL